MLSKRIPIKKKQTLQEVFSVKILTKNFLQAKAYSLSENAGVYQSFSCHPLRNILNVSVGRMVLHSAPWCSGLAQGLIWRCQVGCLDWGYCRRRQKQWGTGPHSQKKKALKSSNLGLWWLGPAMTRWQVNIHFCAKDIRLREIVLSEQSELLN